tara:strand:+ start:1476 stop:1721 length:246 start_codon:yes stop_codon:yes gene_type:complete
MSNNHHPLVNEFPEHRETIHSLKVANNHFRRLMDTYEETDKKIIRMEEGIETPEDSVVINLKKHRLDLKDQISELLRANEA